MKTLEDVMKSTTAQVEEWGWENVDILFADGYPVKSREEGPHVEGEMTAYFDAEHLVNGELRGEMCLVFWEDSDVFVDIWSVGETRFKFVYAQGYFVRLV